MNKNAILMMKEFLAHPESEWDNLFGLYGKDAQEIAVHTGNLAERAACLEAYLGERGANGTGDAGHEKALQAAAERGKRIRRALGYLR